MPRLVLAIALLVVVGPASAQEAPSVVLAQRRFEQGRQAYGAGDFALALEAFKAAASVMPVPELSYNIGRCLEQLGREEEAAAHYRDFLRARPESDAGREVQARLDAIVARHPRASRRRAYAAPITVGGAALAVAVVATGLVASVAPALSDLKATGCDEPCDAVDRLKARAYAGYVLFGVAGAAAAVDVALWVLAARRPSVRAALVRLGTF